MNGGFCSKKGVLLPWLLIQQHLGPKYLKSKRGNFPTAAKFLFFFHLQNNEFLKPTFRAESRGWKKRKLKLVALSFWWTFFFSVLSKHFESSTKWQVTSFFYFHFWIFSLKKIAFSPCMREKIKTSTGTSTEGRMT